MVYILKLLLTIFTVTSVILASPTPADWLLSSVLAPVPADEIVMKMDGISSNEDLGDLNFESDLSGLDPIQLFEAPHFRSLLSLHKDLIEIESVSNGEAAVGDYLADYLRNLGLTVETQDAPNENDENYSRSNIYAYMGKKRDTRVLLTSHIDTVPPFFNYSVEGRRIYGRGAVDDKNCVSAQVIAFLDLWRAGDIIEGDLGLLFVVGEENNGSGARYAHENLGVTSWESVIFGEPTERKLGLGHKGLLAGDIEVFGKAAHSGYPHLGISATDILVNILYNLKRQEKSLPQGELLGNSTINIGHIEGGVALNVVPAYAKASFAIRVGDDIESTRTIVSDLVDKYGGEHTKLTWGHFLAVVQCDYEVPGFETAVMAYGTDIPNFGPGDFKRYLYGSGTIHVAHSATEYIEIDDLILSVGGYKRLVGFSLNT